MKKPPKEYDIVKNFIIYTPDREFNTHCVSKELGITEAIIEQCFYFMNLEGLLSQACRPHHAQDHVDRPNYYIKSKKCADLSKYDKDYYNSEHRINGNMWYEKYNGQFKRSKWIIQ